MSGMQTLEGPADIDFLGAGARWSILAIALWATASSFLFINGFAFLIPALRSAGGIPLTQSSLLASIPSWGMVLTLLPWGYAVDRLGERTVPDCLLRADCRRGIRPGFAAFVLRNRCPAVSGRDGRSRLQHRRWSTGVSVVPAASTWCGDGNPSNCSAGGNRVGSVGDAGTGRAGRNFRAVVSRCVLHYRRRDRRHWYRRSRAESPTMRQHRRTGQSVSRVLGVVADTCGVGIDDDAPGGDRDVHACLVDGPPGLVVRDGGRLGDCLPIVGCVGPHRGWPIV